MASSSNEIATLTTYDDYELSFEMYVNGMTSGSGSILHIGDSNGQRFPGVWFHADSYNLYVKQSQSYCEECCCEYGAESVDAGIVQGGTYNVTIRVRADVLRLYVDGALLSTEAGSGTYSAADQSVYVGDPWHGPADVELRHIRYTYFSDACAPTSGPSPVPTTPVPTPAPTPSPTRTPVVSVSLVMSGLQCADFNATVFRLALGSVMPSATVSDEACTDATTSSISVMSEVSVPLAVVFANGVVNVHEYVTNVLNQAVSNGTLTAAIVSFANQLGQRRRLDEHQHLRRLDAGGMSAASVESASVNTFSPSPAPSHVPTPAPTPSPTASLVPTSLPTPVPTVTTTEVRTYTELQQAISQAAASSTALVIDLLADICYDHWITIES